MVLVLYVASPHFAFAIATAKRHIRQPLCVIEKDGQFTNYFIYEVFCT